MMYPIVWNLIELKDEIEGKTLNKFLPYHSSTDQKQTIFNYLSSFPWNSTADMQEFNCNAFLAQYGDCIVSPFLEAFGVGEEVPEYQKSRIAAYIKARFKAKWDRLWGVYTSNVDPLSTVNLSTSESGLETRSHGESGTDTTTYNTVDAKAGADTTTYGKVESNSGTDTTTYGKREDTVLGSTNARTYAGSYSDATSGSDSGHVTRSGSQADAESGATAENTRHEGTRITSVQHSGTISDAGTSSGTDSVWGFNSPNSVPSTATSASDGNTRTLNNTDSTTDSPSLTDSSTTTHGKTTTTTFNNVKDETANTISSTTTRTYTNHVITDTKSGTDSVSNSGTDRLEHGKRVTASGSDSKQTNVTDTHTGTDTVQHTSTVTDSIDKSRNSITTGYSLRRLADKIELIDKLFNDPAYMGFFETVYADIASLLTINVFM